MKNNHITKQLFSIITATALILGSPVMPPAAVSAEPAGRAAVIEDEESREINFNKDWKFLLDETEELDASAKNYNDADWDAVRLPHDFSITQDFAYSHNGVQLEAESGFLPGGTGWYRKNVIFPSSYDGKSVILNFDGVYNNAYVYINDTKIGEHHYGYTNFSFDISDLITCDGTTENVIAVKAVNEFPSSRWYSGSGIYRDVTLTVADPVHVALNGTYVTTPELEKQKNGDVTVRVETTVQNDGDAAASAKVRTSVLDKAGSVVSKSAAEGDISIAAGAASDLTQELAVTAPKLWDYDNPNLYYVQTEIVSGNKVIDSYTTEFGFRYFNYDANTGFSLNGNKVKMKGVCMHHDQGALGGIASYDALYRQVEKLKEMGCNAIRTSHNAPSRNFLEICNELGMLVMDEVYDGWSYHKNGNSKDFGAYWNETLGEDNHLLGGSKDKKYYQFCLESFVDRDKNDPCNIMWSIGNEINFGVPDTTVQQYVNEYKEYTSNMIDWIQAIDPTRPITHGDNQVAGNVNDLRTQVDMLLAESGGVVGLNYSPGAYSRVHQQYPDWPLVGSETASSINSRGVYYSKAKHTETGNYQNTAYDTHCVSWGQRARAAWLPVISNDFMMGTFIWTGFDYIGEPTDWNGTGPGSVSGDPKAMPNSSYFGIIDTAGFPKDSYYFYTSQWKEDAATLHIVPGCWNEDDLVVSNGKVDVDIYSNAAKVELFLNDKLIGTAQRESITTNAGYEYGIYRTTAIDADNCTAKNSESNTDSNNLAAQFAVTYEAGTLSAKAYDANGKEISDTVGIKTVKTNSDEGSILRATPEKTEILADGSSLCYIDVDILDGNGEFASQADNLLRFSLNGNGEIAGVDNGNASTVDKFQQKSVLTDSKTASIQAFSGKALVIVRSTEYSGGFSLRIDSEGMETKTVTVDTLGDNPGEVYLKSHDLKTFYSVDMYETADFETEATATKSDGSQVLMSVEWDSVDEEIYQTPGNYSVSGVASYESEEIPVTAVLQVKPIIKAVKNISRATVSGVTPALPKTVTGLLPDGRTYGSYPVTWDNVSASDFTKVGDNVIINGSASISDDVTMPVKMSVRIAESAQADPVNIAPKASLSETCSPASDSLDAITDGLTDKESALQKDPQGRWQRWTNWDSALLNSSPTIIFQWEEMQTISRADIYYFTDDSVTLPASVTFRFSEDGKTYEEVPYTSTEIDSSNNKATYTFASPQNAKTMRLTITPYGDTVEPRQIYVGIIECEVYNTGITYDTNHTARLNSLNVNGTPVTGFVSGEYNKNGYTMKIASRIENAVFTAETSDNAAATILPIDRTDTANVVVRSEDGSEETIYRVKLESSFEEDFAPLKPEISAVTTEASSKLQNDYTPESWNVFQAALTAFQTAIDENGNATAAEIKTAMENLKNAMKQLARPSSTPPDTTPPGTNPPGTNPPGVSLPQKGKTYKDAANKAEYTVTSSNTGGGTVTFKKPLKKTNKSFTVPDKVTIQNRSYKVTAIDKNAFKNNRKLTTVTIGKNVKTIGASAFEGAKNLKSIKIKAAGLKSVGKKAFKGIHAKAKIKVPKAKLSSYKKKLKGKGQKSSVKISG